MRRRVLLYIVCVLLGLLVLALAGFSWLVGTAGGARFALTALSGVGGGKLTVGRVEGRLLDHLSLTGVRLKEPKLSTEVDRLELDWRPGGLLHRDLAVGKLAVSGVRIQDDRPPSGKPTTLSWPRVSGLARLLERLDDAGAVERVDERECPGCCYRCRPERRSGS